MSGLAAGIRLALGGQSVLILERHEAPGGLNSFYRLGGRNYDVGLHAMTNFVPPGTRRAPLTKLFRQLRIDREEFDLHPQKGSRIAFPGRDLYFGNGLERLRESIAEVFPGQVDGFQRLVASLPEIDSLSANADTRSARSWMATFLSDPQIVDMLLCPLCYYGSAIEDDLELAQFAILFQAIYEEGFARPRGGVRTVIRALLRKFKTLGGERRMRCGVRRIIHRGGSATSLLLDDGSEIRARSIFSTIGRVETDHLMEAEDQPAFGRREAESGKLSFVETISVLDSVPGGGRWEDTIVFFSTRSDFRYRCPPDLVDPSSGVICLPHNYDLPPGDDPVDPMVRVTALASYRAWKSLSPSAYKAAKEEWFQRLRDQAIHHILECPASQLPSDRASDMFTPLTIERFTGHLGGAVYGSGKKVRSGRTRLDNVYICGTDQGFLGITGAMLSGISIANQYGLRPGEA